MSDDILVKGSKADYGNQIETAQLGTAALPGTLVEKTAFTAGDSDYPIVNPHDAAGIVAHPTFLVGATKPTFGIDDQIDVNEDVEIFRANSGDKVRGLVPTATSGSVGDLLVSNGAGLLVAPAAGEEEHAVCIAGENWNNTSGSASRLLVEPV
jgi:hypothetical protein